MFTLYIPRFCIDLMMVLILDGNLFRHYTEDGVIVAETVWLDIALTDITDHPNAFNRLHMLIVGDVVGRVAASAFQLDDDSLLGFDTLLVVNHDGVYWPLSNGIVRTFDLVAVEDELGYDLVESDCEIGNDRPVFIASPVVPSVNSMARALLPRETLTGAVTLSGTVGAAASRANCPRSRSRSTSCWRCSSMCGAT